jgi:hypothetical protein
LENEHTWPALQHASAHALSTLQHCPPAQIPPSSQGVSVGQLLVSSEASPELPEAPEFPLDPPVFAATPPSSDEHALAHALAAPIARQSVAHRLGPSMGSLRGDYPSMRGCRAMAVSCRR